MKTYEYAVVPAPKRGLKARGVRSTEDRFANALQTVMNAYGAEGWEYVRTDTLPCEERQGLTGRTTVFQNMLVFRRTLASEESAAPEAVAALPAPAPQIVETPVADAGAPAAPQIAAPSDTVAETGSGNQPPLFTPRASETGGLPTPDPRLGQTLSAIAPEAADRPQVASKPLDKDPARPEPRLAAE